jgi:hypothetical protein
VWYIAGGLAAHGPGVATTTADRLREAHAKVDIALNLVRADSGASPVLAQL